jgi:hypothetical protein
MAQGPMATSSFGYQAIDDSGDDLPRTFRREKEARAREAEARAAKERAANPSLPSGSAAGSGPATANQPSVKPASSVSPSISPQISVADDVQPMTGAMTYPATVKRFDVPFMHLMMFFLKAVMAAIPALMLLAVVLGIIGTVLGFVAPDLMRLKVLIGVGT